MKVYLVGGAVRDSLLGYPVKDKDWVVVGATPKELEQQNYKQVGKDFPVFLHPQTKEEYALARKEKKSGQGYHGFQCDFSSNVTLEEDLWRRDLTINAMAMDEQGQIMDPFNGQGDLKKKLLRHVSPAFAEDPVRVLRVARFAARYAHLGFTIADETMRLMIDMVEKGDLLHLVAERVWQEWKKSLEEKNPEQFLLVLQACGALQTLFPEIHLLLLQPSIEAQAAAAVKQDVGISALEALQSATRITPSPLVRFAAFLHKIDDIAILKKLYAKLHISKDYEELASLTTTFHTIINHRDPSAKAILDVLLKTDAFHRPDRFKMLLLTCQACCQPLDQAKVEIWTTALSACNKVKATSFLSLGHKGIQLRDDIYQQRLVCIQELLLAHPEETLANQSILS